jgi:hypothetical protein
MERRKVSEQARLPGWLKVANPAIVALQRRGMVIGTVRPLRYLRHAGGVRRSGVPVCFRVEEAGL